MTRETLDRLILFVIIIAIIMVVAYRREGTSAPAAYVDNEAELKALVQASTISEPSLIASSPDFSSIYPSRDIFAPLVHANRPTIPTPPKVTKTPVKRTHNPLRANLTGVIAGSDGEGRAILDNDIYSTGEKIQGYTIKEISSDSVTFEDGDGNITVISNAERLDGR